MNDEQKNVARQCLSEAQEEEKNLVTGITGMNPDSGIKHAESEIIESLPISEWLRVRAIHGERGSRNRQAGVMAWGRGNPGRHIRRGRNARAGGVATSGYPGEGAWRGRVRSCSPPDFKRYSDWRVVV